MPAGSTASADCSQPKGIRPRRRNCRWSINRLPPKSLGATPRAEGAGARRMDHPPLWRRIVDFPLVAMMLAIAVFLLAAALADLLNRFAIPPIHEPNLRAAVRATVVIVFLL